MCVCVCACVSSLVHNSLSVFGHGTNLSLIVSDIISLSLFRFVSEYKIYNEEKDTLIS